MRRPRSLWRTTLIQHPWRFPLCLLLAASAQAQPGSLDATFDPGAGVDQSVYALLLQADGRVLVGGDFTTFQAVPRHGIARVGSNGALNDSFDPGAGANDQVNSIALQTNSEIIAGGYFTSFSGMPRGRIARLTGSGTADSGFPSGSGADAPVLAVAVQPDGNILLGGPFSDISGKPRTNIARLNANGTVDPGFVPDSGVGLGAVTVVNALALQKDGKVLIAGLFGQGRNTARLNGDGSLDTNFSASVNVTGASVLAGVYALAVQGDGKVLVGGDFTGVNGFAHTNLARLNTDGTLDMDFNSSAGTDFAVSAIALQGNGKILVAGYFGTINGVPRNGIARLNSDGTLDKTFDPGSGADGAVYAMAVQPDGKVLIGGAFTHFDDVPRSGIARLLGDAVIPPPRLFNPSWKDGVLSVSVATVSGNSYALQYKDSLADANWTTLTPVAGDGTPKTFSDTGATGARRFYRVEVQ